MHEEPTVPNDELLPDRWEDAPRLLRRLAAQDLAAGRPPSPALVAHEGERPLALLTLRPFADGEAIRALVEVLALLLPLGADRTALALPGRAWSLDDPIPPVTDDADLRARVLVVITADAHDGPCDSAATLWPYSLDASSGHWQAPVDVPGPLSGPAVAVLTTLLDRRDELPVGHGDELRLAAQLARVLLRGHEVTLAPEVARRLEAAAVGRVDPVG